MLISEQTRIPKNLTSWLPLIPASEDIIQLGGIVLDEMGVITAAQSKKKRKLNIIGDSDTVGFSIRGLVP